jgi:tyrosinase
MDTGALTIPYARVKAILDDAAGDSSADYGGAGRFWGNGARALENAEIFGVKMVAPPPRRRSTVAASRPCRGAAAP